MANPLLLPSRDQWPVGFRFHPTDEELINHYLKNKIVGQESLVQFIPQVDICKYEPWELPGLSNDQTGEHQWFFFSAQDFKYSNGRRSNRATGTGYWKSTGKDRKIMARGTNKLIGTKKTLVFYTGRIPKGIRTNWVIHEYRLHPDPNFAHLKSYVICLLKRKWDESDVLIREEAEPNDLLTSTNVATTNQNQEIPGNGQSLIQSDLHVSDYDFPELQSPLFSEPEPTSLDFQITNSHGAHLINGPTDEAINSVFVDDENFFHEGTPTSSFSDFNWEELLSLVDEDQGSSGKDTTAICQYDHDSPIFFGKRARSIIQTTNMPIVEESHRSPLASKILKTGGAEKLSSNRPREESFQINCLTSCHSDDSDKELRNFSSRRQLKYHKELDHVESSQSVRSIDLSSVHPREYSMSINCIKSCGNDDFDRAVRNFSSQRQPKSHKVRDHIKASQNVQSKKETQIQVVPSLSKVKAVPERIEVVKPAATSHKDTAEDKQSEVENSVANRPKLTGHGSRGSRIVFLKYPDYKMHSPQIKSRLIFVGQRMCRTNDVHFVREGRKTSATVWKLRINGAGNYTHTNKLPMFSRTKMVF